MKFPYGIFDFREIVTQGYFYCDRTRFISTLEDTGNYLLFIRPRRFGKSLLLSMLENYYDVARQEQFEEMFGHLDIGKNSTPLRNRFFILKWDFSCVDPTGSAEDVKKALHDHVNGCVRSFSVYYEKLLPRKIEINWGNAILSVQSLMDAVRMTPYPVYLLIDEYDNFANEIMADVHDGQKTYESLVYEKGPLKTLFKTVKSMSGTSGFARSFITGVSPVVMSDITSGYNIAENIYLNNIFHSMCGFTEKELNHTVQEIVRKCGFREEEGANALNLMRTYYNGYVFGKGENPLYNPTLAIYFMKIFQSTCEYPRKMLDANLAADEAKLEYISRIPSGRQILIDLMQADYSLAIPELADRFGIRQMLSETNEDDTFMASFLYYFGVLTMAEQTEKGELRLKVPNLVMRGLYAERIKYMLMPEPRERDEGLRAAKALSGMGDIRRLCEFIEQRFFKVFHNRDYRWANELTVKTAFLSLLYNDILYIMDSEKEAGRGYADLTMIIRPDMRKFDIFDILIEFKYVSLKKAGMTAEQARALTPEALKNLPAMQSEMAAAKKQIRQYGDVLEKKYGKLRLKRFAVVSLGYERLLYECQGLK